MTDRIKALLSNLLVFTWCLATAILAIFLLRAVYDWAIVSEQLVQRTGVSHKDLLANYDHLIDYLINPLTTQLNMPHFPSSADGLFHFYEVKMLIHFCQTVWVITTIALIAFKWRRKSNPLYEYYYVQYSKYLPFIPVVLGVLMSINFNAFFIAFHHVLFRNDKWVFNPASDPIITALPQTFFMICFMIVCVIFEGLLIGHYIYYKRKYRRPQ